MVILLDEIIGKYYSKDFKSFLQVEGYLNLMKKLKEQKPYETLEKLPAEDSYFLVLKVIFMFQEALYKFPADLFTSFVELKTEAEHLMEIQEFHENDWDLDDNQDSTSQKGSSRASTSVDTDEIQSKSKLDLIQSKKFGGEISEFLLTWEKAIESVTKSKQELEREMKKKEL